MSNILSRMKQSLIRYAEVIFSITDATVSIIDADMIRLFYIGGEWRTDTGMDTTEIAHIARTALETGQSQIMLEAGGHPGCRNCGYRDKCKEKVEMWTPIIAGRESLGILGFVAETTAAEEKITANPQVYLEFLEKIADMIAYEAIAFMENQRDKRLVQLLKTIFERLDAGVIVLDRDEKIALVNKTGRTMLRDKFYELESAPLSIRETGNVYGHMKEYELCQENEHYLVAGNYHALDLKDYATVLIFNNRSKIIESQNRVSFYQKIIGSSREMQLIRNQIKMASRSPSSVLISAEDGLDRGMYAQAIHDESERREKPFVVIDCALLPEDAETREKYLFGSVPAAGGSAHGKVGQIERAIGGTLVLRHIDALTSGLQQQLVQLMETQQLFRVGSKKYRRADIRVIATTKQNLREMSALGTFDSTLYYLISVIPITIPPLRNRREDIRQLAAVYINNSARRLGKTIHHIDDEFWRALERYDWPGNIQELKNAMEHVVNMLMHSNTIQANMLPEQIRPAAEPEIDAHLTLEEVERGYIRRALEIGSQNGQSREEIAQQLGIGIATLYRKIKKYQL